MKYFDKVVEDGQSPKKVFIKKILLRSLFMKKSAEHTNAIKRTTILALVVFSQLAFVSCDAPRDRRLAYEETSLNNLNTNNNTSTGRDTATTTTTTSTTTSSTSLVKDLPSSIQSKFSSDGVNSFTNSSTHLGDYNIAQDSSNTNDVYLQLKAPIQDATVCMIPVHQEGGSSFYIGGPVCKTVATTAVAKFTLSKNRYNFDSYSLNGVMVMKDKAYFYPTPFYRYVLSPDAYLFCQNWLQQKNDSSYCQAFKQLGQYKFHSL